MLSGETLGWLISTIMWDRTKWMTYNLLILYGTEIVRTPTFISKWSSVKMALSVVSWSQIRSTL